jgi:hypothetical protein
MYFRDAPVPRSSLDLFESGCYDPVVRPARCWVHTWKQKNNAENRRKPEQTGSLGGPRSGTGAKRGNALERTWDNEMKVRIVLN